MKSISINNVPLTIKDYYCCPCDSSFGPLEEEGYYLQDNPGLWLYINVTNRCNAACPFCVFENKGLAESIDLEKYQNALKLVAPYVRGVAFTGGEPMLDPPLLNTMVDIADTLVDNNVEFDMVTNGINLEGLPRLMKLNRLSTIHISRHAIDDDENRNIMMWDDAPSWDSIKQTVSQLYDPGSIVLNCVLQKGGVQNMDDVCVYLDKAIDAGIRNTSFIAMMPANTFCVENYISPDVFKIATEEQAEFFNNTHNSKITIWNRMRDHDYCKCLSGSYESDLGRTRFYFRFPGDNRKEDYCRQLVYTADNRLQDGFGSKSTFII